MIKKIELKIFLSVFILLSVIIGAIVTYNAFNSYNSTIKGITSYIERINDDRRNVEKDIDGMYTIKVVDQMIVDEEDYSDEIIESVKEILDSHSESGIIKNYIYKNRSQGGFDKKRWNDYFTRK